MRKFAASSSQAGFSLIELMITVSIIGLLASIAVPNFQGFVARTRQTEAKGALSAMFAVEAAVQAEYNSYTVCLYPSGYEPNAGSNRFYTSGSFLSSITAGTPWDNPATGLACDYGSIPWGGSTRNDGIFASNIDGNPAGCFNPGYTSSMSVSTFRLAAMGSISASAYCDIWEINETKVITNIQSGI